MTLIDAFEKYPDETKLRRKDNTYFDAPISWWKMHAAWAKPEHRKEGFIIPDFMIEDANANDFEVVNDKVD